MVNVNFVAQGDSYLASKRMRVLKPAVLMNKKVEGLEVNISEEAQTEADVNIFSKHFEPKKTLQAMKDLSYYSIFDICDDHFDREHGEYYEEACELADVVMCSSPNLQTRIYEVTGKLARIVKDPITFPQNAVPTIKMITDKTPKFIWFGHGSNLIALEKWLKDFPSVVDVISNTQISHPKVNFTQWKPNLVEKRIEDYDIVLLPTVDQPWVKNKSPNRVVDALISGKFVITDNEELYGEFKDFIYIVKNDEEIFEAINFWINEPEKVVKMLEKGQEYVKQEYSDESYLLEWLDVLKETGVIKEYEKC